MTAVDCSNCRTPLQPPPSGAQSIRCPVCQAITSPRAASTSPATSSSQPLAPPHVPPSHGGRKKAVICGISYKSSRDKLSGSLNDAKCMRYLLINKFQFSPDSILMLTEEESDPYRIPTKHNIRMALYWLVTGCQPGDSLVFHYSGHGSRQQNYNGDEIDGYDQTLRPLDFETQGVIVDDEINATIVRPLPCGVKLHAIIDACHSGTVLDLPYLYRRNRMGQYVWEDRRPPSGIWKGSGGGEVVSFGGCDDEQSSADISAMSKDAPTGIMTYCFIQAIELGQASTYGSLLSSMRAAIQRTAEALAGGVGVTSLLNKLVNGGSLSWALRQEPQLTAWEPFDVDKKPFSL